ncbi:MAG: ABC transporter substrate-binding protein [Alphaproteobacteria bacterium]|nr:ABC transporter substrate-binding protein [Alphaproteobacteria bacterium]
MPHQLPRLLPRLLAAAALFAVTPFITAPARAAVDLVVAVSDNLNGLDPHDLNDNISQAAARLTHEGLFKLDRDMKLVNGLAESFTANEAATEFVFKLRRGVAFPDGTPFNAGVVKFSFDRGGNPANNLKRQSIYVMIDHTDVVDDYTVKVTLKYPFGAFPNNLAHPGALIVNPTLVNKFGKEFTRNATGTGPYELVSWGADALKLKKNAKYRMPGLPKIDTLTYKSVPENGSRLAMLQTGEAQFITPVPPEMIRIVERNADLVVFDKPSLLSLFATMHNQKKPFNDIRVRTALNLAIDKKAYSKVVWSGYADELDSPMAPGLQFYAKQTPFPYDPAKAKALLAEAGYPNGFEVTISGGPSTIARRGMEFVQQQLAMVGVKVTVEALEAGVLTAKLYTNPAPETAAIQMLLTGWSSSTGDADWGIRPFLWGKGFPPVLNNFAYYKSQIVDDAIEAGLSTVDPVKRAAAYATAQAQAWKDAPLLFLGMSHNLAAYSKKLKGASMRGDQQFQLDDDASLD